MKKLFIAFLLTILTFSTTYTQPIRVLFIGNSYTAVNNLPQMVSSVALSVGDSMTFESNTPGGCTFQQHCSNNSMTMICKGGWDVVVLQEQSQIPSFPINQVEEICFPFATQLVDSIYSRNICSRAMFYMTWGRKNGDSQNCPVWPPVCTYEGMDSLLYERYMTMGETNMADVAPVGAVWHFLRDYFPDIELYSGDGSHPSLAGSYAAACTFYAMIFQKNPAFIIDNLNVPDETADIIKQAAKTIVYDSLWKWTNVENESVIADYSFTELENRTVEFQNLSEHATAFEWNFGDGTFSDETNPVHQFEESGDYQVTLTASNEYSSDSVSKIVSVTNVAVKENDATKIQIFPNPTHDEFMVLNAENCYFEVYNMQGNRILHTKCTSIKQCVNISNVPTGVYLIKIFENKTLVAIRKIVKK